MLRTLTHRILLIIVPIFVGIMVAAVISITNLLAVEEQVDHLGTETVEQMRLSMEYTAQLQRLITEVTAYTYTGNPEEREEAEAAIDQAGTILAALDATTLHGGDNVGAAEAAEAKQLQQQRIDLLAEIAHLLDQVVQQRQSQARVNIVGALETLEELEEEGEALTARVNAHLAEDVVQSRQAATASMRRGLFGIIGALVVTGMLMLVSVLLLQRQIIRPIRAVSQAAVAVTQDDLTRRVTVTSQDEVGNLQQSFNQMVASLQTQRELLEQRNQELADERAALKQALDDLHRSSAERTALLENTVEQLSAPILPVRKGVLVMPIIGAVSEQRAQRLQSTLLHTIAARHARIVILDVTGLTAVNPGVVQALIETIQSTLLLGARPVVVGINPAMATALTELGAPLEDLRAMADLEAAVAFALQPV
jgi:rsbT co-antagonist protein RsbR